MKNSTRSIALLGLLALASVSLAHSQTRAGSSSHATSAATTTPPPATPPISAPIPAVPPGLTINGDQISYEVPFSEFMTENEQVILRNTNGSYSIAIPIADRVDVQNAIFHLEYTSSINLLDERSQLAVSLNGQAIAQIPLRHAAPEGTVDIRLPNALLHHGYNRLSLTVAQHFTLKCEDPSAPELWTQINTEKSTLTFQGKLSAWPAKLSQLDRLFDRKSWGSQKLNVITSDNEIDLGVKWGALAAEGAALRLRYVPLEVTRATTLVPNADNLVVGTTAQLASMLGTSPQQDIQGSYIGLMPSPADPSHFELIISGRTPEEVDRALATFCVINFPFPDSASMVISDLKLPTYVPYQSQMLVKEDRSYRFSELGYKTSTIQGWTHGNPPNYFQFDLNLPPDIYTPETSQIGFRLHFAHGAGMREDSVLNLYVNGNFENAIYLNNPNGADYQDYRIEVPVRDFKPGSNEIRFTPAMVPLKSDFCEIIQEQNLLLTLFDNSIVEVPSMSHYATLPDLTLFNRTLFPLATAGAGSDMTVEVTAKDSATLGAAWTLLAKLSQKVGLPLHDADVSLNTGSTNRNLVVIGASNQIPPDVMKAAPFHLGSPDKIAYQQAFLRSMGERDNNDDALHADVSATGGLGSLGIAMQFQSPYASDKTVFLVSAKDADLLLKRCVQLVSPAIWSSLQGDVCVWDSGDTVASGEMIGKTYTVGSVTINTRADYLISKHPLVFALGVVGLVVLVALLVRSILDRHKVRHHGREGTSDSH